MNSNFLQTPIVYLKGVGPNRAELLRSELGIESFQDLLPIYPSTEKLSNSGITNKVVSKLIQQLFIETKANFGETLSKRLIEELKLISKSDALLNIHFPKNQELLAKAQFRLKFEELFYVQLQLLNKKAVRKQKIKGLAFDQVGENFNAFFKNHLPFNLTNAQKRVIKEIRNDLGSSAQMNRLLQGDVGSGKTIVALMCMLLAIDNGLWKKGNPPLTPPEGRANEIHHKYQTARPSTYNLLKQLQKEQKKQSTEAEQILWEQLKTKKLNVQFRRQHIIDMFIVDFVCLSKKLIIEVDGGYHKTATQKEADELRTQILNEFGYKVIRFTNAEVIGAIDKVLKTIESVLKSLPSGEVGGALPPHILVMTATPIPRTLAMSLYGDLDISVIDELPPGRKPIKTVHRYDANRLKVFQFIRDEIKKGRQIYIVYPLIQESEALDYKDLMDGYESIARDFPLPDYQISIVHGKMKPADKDYEMERFVRGETQLMVATTVIEVGVNVPNASVMIIESAERFGLSQLHQLRGRVGRGAEQSFCILMTSHKLSSDAKTRLETMVRTNDGFEIAEVDLKLRGPGDLMGTQQSGLLNLKIADIVKDNQILKSARYYAIQLLKDDPKMAKTENLSIRQTYSNLSKDKAIWGYIS